MKQSRLAEKSVTVKFDEVRKTERCSVFFNNRCVKCGKKQKGFNSVCDEKENDEHLSEG